MPSIAIIVPVLNEIDNIEALIGRLSRFEQRLVIVDGGSTDGTDRFCSQSGVHCLQSEPGRATQMNAGAGQADADVLWFVHADCIPPDDSVERIKQVIASGRQWGRFNVRLTSDSFIFRIIEKLMNGRSCLTQVATGDQGIFVARELFDEIGAYPDIPLMEDIAISKRLRRKSPCACITSRMKVSARRWQDKGVIRTILLMWWLRWRYFIGARPVDLHRSYYGSR